MRLEDVLAVAYEFDYRNREDLQKLDDDLANAKVVESKDVPPDVVAMNFKKEFE